MNKTLLKILPKITCIPKPIKGSTKDKKQENSRIIKYKSIKKQENLEIPKQKENESLEYVPKKLVHKKTVYIFR